MPEEQEPISEAALEAVVPADPDREARRLIAGLEALGKHVTVHDAA